MLQSLPLYDNDADHDIVTLGHTPGTQSACTYARLVECPTIEGIIQMPRGPEQGPEQKEFQAL